jgi:glycerol-3-phosphate dehydrogenase
MNTNPARPETSSLTTNPHTKILIIGGGIHGAALARIAALNGTDCLLLEKQDYASGTSSRSSKMAHGGLRYLETFDFQQVFEGIKAREQLFDEARHICKPDRFLIPVQKNDWWFRVKLGIGLYLYDLMVTMKERRHGWINRKDLTFDGFHSGRTDLMGCYSYCDGIFNDARLVVETVVHARELGARCFNYIGVESVKKLSSGKFEVTAKDEITGDAYTLTADLVVNCTGPWAPFIGHEESKPLAKQLRYSAGIHLIFNRPWNQPSLFLPMEQKNRYYFVWPHPGGTMVGTTEREVTGVPLEQFPVESEIQEVLQRVTKDLPDAGLNQESLHYAFAGVRTLPLRDENAQGTATLSRKHIWKNQAGVLTLLGGKWTTSSWTSFEGYKEAMKMLGLDASNAKSLTGVKFPGWATDQEQTDLRNALIKKGVSESTAGRIVRRLGSRAKYLLENDSRTELLTPNLLRGEVELAIKDEQAMTVEDILRRRTEIEYMNGSGIDEVAKVQEVLSNFTSASHAKSSADGYVERIRKIFKLIGKKDSGAVSDKRAA